MKVELFIYLIIFGILSAIRRVISGMKNGCFYAKHNTYEVPVLEKYIKNLHFLETPAWYTQFGGVFIISFAVARSINYTWEFSIICLQLLGAYLITMGSSAMASFHFQGYINKGSNLPWIDPNENKKSEFAFGKISFWWYRPWYGKRRLYSVYIGTVELIIGSLIILNIW